uniref:Uncharacterized protein n=1 Tax=Palpitomonas bilix TaxID=652834 RepID=A0A7S3G8M6_9EUKA
MPAYQHTSIPACQHISNRQPAKHRSTQLPVAYFFSPFSFSHIEVLAFSRFSLFHSPLPHGILPNACPVHAFTPLPPIIANVHKCKLHARCLCGNFFFCMRVCAEFEQR